MRNFLHFLSYLAVRMICFPISLLPLPLLHQVGRWLGRAAYYCHFSFRKKTLTNLSIASKLALTEEEKKKIAKKSFESLAITCLEFCRLHKENIDHLIIRKGAHVEIETLLQKGTGIIFLTAHQANWEIPFLFMTQHYPGVAIGRPIKNKRLYNWVLSMREKYKGRIVMPKHAIKEGLAALKRGHFLGIVGDQAFPGSPYSFPLFGTRAWTASTPALLSYRTGAPLVVASTERIKGKYAITVHPPLWPDLEKPMKEEVSRLMDSAMGYLEKSIEERPDEWLWQHDRWKQQGIDHVKRKYRFGFICIVFPQDPTPFLPLLSTFREIYPRAFLSFFVPRGWEEKIGGENIEVHAYSSYDDLFVRDYRYQLLFDFIGLWRLRCHYRRLGVFRTVTLKKIKQSASRRGYSHEKEWSKLLKLAICK